MRQKERGSENERAGGRTPDDKKRKRKRGKKERRTGCTLWCFCPIGQRPVQYWRQPMTSLCETQQGRAGPLLPLVTLATGPLLCACICVCVFYSYAVIESPLAISLTCILFLYSFSLSDPFFKKGTLHYLIILTTRKQTFRPTVFAFYDLSSSKKSISLSHLSRALVPSFPPSFFIILPFLRPSSLLFSVFGQVYHKWIDCVPT